MGELSLKSVNIKKSFVTSRIWKMLIKIGQGKTRVRKEENL